jgi:acetyl-CoA carboxylase beta subunit
MWGNTVYIADINTLDTKTVSEERKETMEECPKCKKWTLFYNPRNETMTCASCNYRENVKYETFVKQRNIVDLLRYPNRKETKLTKIEA